MCYIFNSFCKRLFFFGFVYFHFALCTCARRNSADETSLQLVISQSTCHFPDLLYYNSYLTHNRT